MREEKDVATAAPLLQVRDLAVSFGGIVALAGISFDVKAGKICGIIGPNGAGKTTLFNCLSRLYTPQAGSITFAGHSLLAVPASRIAPLGIARTFQNVALFPEMSVLDNVLMGGYARFRTGYLANILRLPHVLEEEEEARSAAVALIEELRLDEVLEEPVHTLSFGTRKRVELARALAAQPKLILLDEPAGGLNHEEVEDLAAIIRAIKDRRGVTVLLVEHHLNLVMRVSDQVVAMDFGRKIADDTPQAVQADPEVIRAYLGTEDA